MQKKSNFYLTLASIIREPILKFQFRVKRNVRRATSTDLAPFLRNIWLNIRYILFIVELTHLFDPKYRINYYKILFVRIPPHAMRAYYLIDLIIGRIWLKDWPQNSRLFGMRRAWKYIIKTVRIRGESSIWMRLLLLDHAFLVELIVIG